LKFSEKYSDLGEKWEIEDVLHDGELHDLCKSPGIL
jgi:hypothetical protein